MVVGDKMNYETTITRTLDYQDVDFTGQIKLSKVLEQLAYVAHLNSIKNEFWNENMMGEYGWIILKQRIRFLKPITIKDSYELTTYPGDYSRVRFHRNSFAKVGDEIVMEQTAIWALLDIEKRRVISPSKLNMKFPEDTKGDILVEFKDVNLNVDFELCHEVKIEYSHIDVNKHLNNVRYLDWCLDTIDIDKITDLNILDISLNYFKESHYKETLRIYRYFSDVELLFKITGPDAQDIRFSCSIEVR